MNFNHLILTTALSISPVFAGKPSDPLQSYKIERKQVSKHMKSITVTDTHTKESLTLWLTLNPSARRYESSYSGDVNKSLVTALSIFARDLK